MSCTKEIIEKDEILKHLKEIKIYLSKWTINDDGSSIKYKDEEKSNNYLYSLAVIVYHVANFILKSNENISKPFVNITPTTCVNFKELILSLLRHQRWTINDVKFSEKGNLESINIKFASEFALGNSPWDPRISGQKVPSQNETI